MIKWLLIFTCIIEAIYCTQVGILYSGWHGAVSYAMDIVAAKGGQQLTVEDVVESNGDFLLSDMLQKYDLLNTSLLFIYMDRPSLGFYCIYRKRQNETTGYIPDCANITQTLTIHANWLTKASMDYVAYDASNLGGIGPEADLLQQRPIEVLFEEWHLLRQVKGNTSTPSICIYADLGPGTVAWRNYLELYNNETYEGLVTRDPATGKKIMFAVMSPMDPNVVDLVESNGGRNDVIVQIMTCGICVSPAQMAQGMWTFFTPCWNDIANAVSSSVVGAPCPQKVTQNSKLGSAMAITPSFQTGYSSLPWQSAGKLNGLTFKKQWANAMQEKPDWIFVASFNEWISQPQPNPVTQVDIGFSMGLPYDPQGRGLYVDSYLWEFSRDIEPSAKFGSIIYDILVSCMRVFRSGSSSCDVPDEICCQGVGGPEGTGNFSNVWSMQSTSAAGYSDYLLSTNLDEVVGLINAGTYSQLCSPFYGSFVFCTDQSLTEAQSGPFITLASAVNENTRALYRCLRTVNPPNHFFSIDPECEGQKTESLLGYVSSVRGGPTLRALYRCKSQSTGAYYHSLDLACPPSDLDAGLFGFVH